jgi:hypothetical protein
MSEMNKPVKTKQYIGKDLDSMTAEELRHGALKWMQAEATGEGLGDARAAKKINDEKLGSIAKMRKRIATLEAQVKGGGQ